LIVIGKLLLVQINHCVPQIIPLRVVFKIPDMRRKWSWAVECWYYYWCFNTYCWLDDRKGTV